MQFRQSFLAFLLFASACTLQAGSGIPYTETSIDLNEEWQYREKGTSQFFPATVPGTIHTDLFRNGTIADPYLGTNENKLQWIETKTWEYTTTFVCSKEIRKKKHLELEFDGIDTYADVYLNDSLLFTAEDMFLSYSIDVKKYIKAFNTLRIVFHPASELIAKNKALSPIKKYPGGDRVFIRKAQYQFGWDWGPRFVTCGIFKPVRLVAWSDFRTTDVVYTLEYLTKDTAYMLVDFMFQADKPGEYNFSVNEGFNQLFVSKYKNKTKKNEHLQFRFKIVKPRLWWCNGLGKPELYTFSLIASRKQKYSSITTTTGIRKIELSSDQLNSDGSFQFILNDVPVFAKGTNWIPLDNFLTRITNSQVANQLNDMQQIHMNMVRVWGGGAFESDYFYSKCDSLGLMVWQDLMFACSMYPYATLDKNNMLIHEINDNYRRLASHPCMALWCGDNENREGWYNWGWQEEMGYSTADSVAIYDEYMNYQLKFMATVNRTDPFFPYVMSSPQNGWGRKEAYQKGDVHYWGVWWGMEPFSSYTSHTGRFVSEFGFQGMPSFHSFNDMGANTSNFFADSTIITHQKHPTGYPTIETYMTRDYGLVPVAFEDYIYLSQVLQRDAMTIAIEAQRRNSPRCMGSLFWQYNDCWPATSWSVVDYFGRKKLAWYSLKRLYEPILVTVQETSDSIFVWVTNETNQEFDKRLTINWNNFEGNPFVKDDKDIKIRANSSRMFWSSSKKTIFGTLSANEGYFNAFLSTQGLPSNAEGESTTALFAKGFTLKLPKDQIKTSFVRYITEGPQKFTVRSKVFVRQVMFTSDDPTAQFSNNGFDMLPNVSYTIEVLSATNAGAVEKTLKVNSLNRLITDANYKTEVGSEN